jgi:hypothetical protein
MKRLAIIATVLLLATTARTAETRSYLTVSRLLAFCDSNDRGEELFCRGYLSGITDTIEDVRRVNKGAPCINRPVQAEELKSVVVAFLRTHVRDDATSGDKPAASLASTAIGQAWCPSQTPGG